MHASPILSSPGFLGLGSSRRAADLDMQAAAETPDASATLSEFRAATWLWGPLSESVDLVPVPQSAPERWAHLALKLTRSDARATEEELLSASSVNYSLATRQQGVATCLKRAARCRKNCLGDACHLDDPRLGVLCICKGRLAAPDDYCLCELQAQFCTVQVS